MSVDGQGIKWRRKIVESFSRLSRAHEHYRQTDRETTDRWATAYSERPWVHIRQKAYRSSSGTLQLQQLQQQVDQYNTEQCQLETTDPYRTTNGKYIALDIDGHCVIVATRSPLLKRVHHFISHSAKLAFLPVETWTSTTCGSSSWSYSAVGVSYHGERTGGFISRALELHNSLLDSAGFFSSDDWKVLQCSRLMTIQLNVVE